MAGVPRCALKLSSCFLLVLSIVPLKRYQSSLLFLWCLVVTYLSGWEVRAAVVLLCNVPHPWPVPGIDFCWERPNCVRDLTFRSIFPLLELFGVLVCIHVDCVTP